MPRTNAYSAIAFETGLMESDIEFDITDVAYRSAMPGSALRAHIAVPDSSAVEVLLERAINLLGGLLRADSEAGNKTLLVAMEKQLGRPVSMARSNDNKVRNSLDLDMDCQSRFSLEDAYSELAAAGKCFLM